MRKSIFILGAVMGLVRLKVTPGKDTPMLFVPTRLQEGSDIVYPEG